MSLAGAPCWVVAVDAGGTHTRAGLYAPTGELTAIASGGPANVVAQGLHASAATIAAVVRGMTGEQGVRKPLTLVAGVAGAFDPVQREELAKALAVRCGAGRVGVADDYHPLLHANAAGGAGVLAIAGTGSKVAAQDAQGNTADAGGRGAAFSEAGSACQVARAALAAAGEAEDGAGPGTDLAHTLPEAAGVPGFTELIPWANRADKPALASLAKCVCACADKGDSVARQILEGEAVRLARLVFAVVHRLALPADIPVFTSGGMFTHSAAFYHAFQNALEHYGGLSAAPLRIHGYDAVYTLAALNPAPPWLAVPEAAADQVPNRLPPTEHIADGPPLDALDAQGMVQRMCEADAEAARSVRQAENAIAEAVKHCGRAIASGGRIVYAGAGTSGRLGVLDAAECPPTFGVAPDRVVALLAGGRDALEHSIEGAEDDPEAARHDVAALSLTPDDVLVGITASGTTPYALAAIDAAAGVGAATVLLCCNPDTAAKAGVVIALDTGPEALPGSTRLKAGTATKCVLNMLSTGAMAHAGYVFEGLMAGVGPVNTKLRDRAVRITAALTGRDKAGAAHLLEQAGDEIAVAVVMARKNVDVATARARLRKAGGRLRNVLKT
ncbi:MAG: N-acetylmuramic acid 6-phosphate etherase [Candidatus Hydrogenedentota bacterium]